MTGDPPGSRTLGVAVVGSAFMGKAHSNAWRNVAAFRPEVPAIERRLLVARDRAATEQAARQFGWAQTAGDWRAVLERDDIDIVDICLPGHLHAEVAIAALAAGKHVLVEKPLANDVAEAEKMLAAATAAQAFGVRSMVGFNYRRVPALALARQLIFSGRLGQVRQIRASYLQDWLVDPASPITWRLRKQTAGSGALGDLGSHAVDQLRFLTGADVHTVSGTLHTFVGERPGPDGPERVNVDDAAWATLQLRGGDHADGAFAALEVSRMTTARKNALRIEVYGSGGALVFDLESLNELWVSEADSGFRRILVTDADQPYLSAWWPPGHTLGWADSFTNQMGDFLVAVAAGTDPVPSFADGLAVQRVLAAVEQSAAQHGQRVSLEER